LDECVGACTGQSPQLAQREVEEAERPLPGNEDTGAHRQATASELDPADQRFQRSAVRAGSYEPRKVPGVVARGLAEDVRLVLGEHASGRAKLRRDLVVLRRLSVV